MPPSIAPQLNTNLIRDHFVRGSRVAADQAAARGLEHIRRHAPVRKLFRGTTFHSVDGMTFSEPHKSGLVARQFRFRKPEPVGAITGRLQLSEAQSERSQAIGHANSEVPVFRFKNKGFQTLVSGDFRRIRNGELVAATPSIVRQKGNRFIDVPDAGPPITARGLKGPDGKRLLTARGAFEVKSGRATFSAPGEPSRIGGRLKGELYAEPAVYVGGHVWAYVVSPTVDPETGYPYPRAQEFGSAHNRPHPFMRPGLHETRNELVNAVKRNVRAGSQAGVE